MLCVPPLLLLLLTIWRATACDLGLPEVDLTEPDAANNLLEAFETFGFAYIKGHNVDESLIKKAEDQAKLFFKLPSRWDCLVKYYFPNIF